MGNLPNWMNANTLGTPAGRVVLNPYHTGTPLVTVPDNDAPVWETLTPGTAVPGSLGRVSGHDVVAFAEVPADPRGPRAGKGSGVFVVIVYRPWHCDRYAVWTCGEFRRDRMPMGAPAPSPRQNGSYVATWERATEILQERSRTLGGAFFAWS